MTEEAATFQDFFDANSQSHCINLIPVFAQNNGIARLLDIASCWRVTFETPEDLAALRASYIVWYKQNEYGQAGWQYRGSSNFTVDGYSAAVKAGIADPKKAQKIRALQESLRKDGLSEDIILVAALDSWLNARIIGDGNHRAIALTLILNETPNDLKSILASKHKVLMLELRSRWAHILYPCDFLDLCAQRRP